MESQKMKRNAWPVRLLALILVANSSWFVSANDRPNIASLATPETNGVLTAMAALTAIEALGEKAATLYQGIAAINPNGPSPDERYNSYVSRIIGNIVPVEGTTDSKKRIP